MSLNPNKKLKGKRNSVKRTDYKYESRSLCCVNREDEQANCKFTGRLKHAQANANSRFVATIKL